MSHFQPINIELSRIARPHSLRVSRVKRKTDRIGLNMLELKELNGDGGLTPGWFGSTRVFKQRARGLRPLAVMLHMKVVPFKCYSCGEGKFLENLIYHGSQLETIDEAVGLAHATGRGSMFSSASVCRAPGLWRKASSLSWPLRWAPAAFRCPTCSAKQVAFQAYSC